MATVPQGLRQAVPVVMVGAATQRLFADVFQASGIFDGAEAISTRTVLWGGEPEPRTLPHEAAAMPESDLLLHLPQLGESPDEPTDWTIFSAKPLPGDVPEHAAGSRTARISAVAVHGAAAGGCAIESAANGWLFLVSAGAGRGWLIACGEDPEKMIEISRLVRSLLNGPAETIAEAPAHPRIAWRPTGAHWLACGGAAVAFDPLSGDGTGHALREGILAAAVVRAVHRGLDPEALLAHYRTRILAAFQKHLAACLVFYNSGGSTPWWREQAEATRRSFSWCAAELAKEPPPRFRLRAFDLEPLA